MNKRYKILLHILLFVMSCIGYANVFAMESDRPQAIIKNHLLTEIVIKNKQTEDNSENELFTVFPRDVWNHIKQYISDDDIALSLYLHPRLGCSDKESKRVAQRIYKNITFRSKNCFELLTNIKNAYCYCRDTNTRDLIQKYIIGLHQSTELLIKRRDTHLYITFLEKSEKKRLENVRNFIAENETFKKANSVNEQLSKATTNITNCDLINLVIELKKYVMIIKEKELIRNRFIEPPSTPFYVTSTVYVISVIVCLIVLLVGNEISNGAMQVVGSIISIGGLVALAANIAAHCLDMSEDLKKARKENEDLISNLFLVYRNVYGELCSRYESSYTNNTQDSLLLSKFLKLFNPAV